jgi:hypothetical protein
VPDQFTIERSNKLVALYRDYRTALDELKVGPMMGYRWWSWPTEKINGWWMIYGQMLDDFATELANSINDLTNHVARLRAWAQLVEPLSDDDRHEATHEFIDQLGIVALGLPYAIKNRFAVAAAHLSHQANRARDFAGWTDEFPADDKLTLNDIDTFGSSWKNFRTFKQAIEPIANRAFKDATGDYRNRFNHGFSPRLLFGITKLVSRDVNEGRVSYGIGGAPPLDLCAIAELIEGECEKCYAAFQLFQDLVIEQITAICSFEKQATKP